MSTFPVLAEDIPLRERHVKGRVDPHFQAPKMEMFQGLLLLLLLSMGGTWASKEPLRPRCRPINATLAVEKEGCPVCITVNATICAGYCPTMTRVLQGVLPALPQVVLPALPQVVCNYRDVRFESIRLPGCPRGVNPVVSYAVALSCQCALCCRSTTDCGGPKDHPLTCDDPRFQASSSSKAPPPSLPSPSRLPGPSDTPILPQ
ncbi:choriogonadotropin subunit beta variant 1 isoform X2 [Pan troglodytes]|nr:choriogonadotropin subunit beta variant 1 isoform X2 [Pan troglodytes]